MQTVPGFHLLKVEAQGRKQDIREHGHLVVLAFSIADDDLAVCKVEILETRAHNLH